MSYILGDSPFTSKSDNGLGSSSQFISTSPVFTGSLTASSLVVGQEKRYQVVGFFILAIDLRKEIPSNINNRVIWTSALLTDMVVINEPVDKQRLILKFADDIKKSMKEYSGNLTDRDLYFHVVEQFRIEAR